MPSRKTNNRRRSGSQSRTAQRQRPQPPSREQAAPDGTGAAPAPKRPAVQMQLGSSTAAKPRATPPATPPPTAARRVQAQRRAARTRAPRGIQIGDQNPAIPLDKVPYFTSDLIRLAITAVIMIILLIIGARLVIPHFIG